jgi:hypothetical protein
MFKKTGLFLLLALAAIAAFRTASFAEANHWQISPVIETAMSDQTVVSIKSIRLLVREERISPPGIPPQANRDIGFASVFIHLENHCEENVTFVIQKIEIRNVSDGRLQAFSQPPQEIQLKPLEISEVVFHLTNKTGYSGQDKVKAIVTYQIGDRVNVIESEPVEVNRR